MILASQQDLWGPFKVDTSELSPLQFEANWEIQHQSELSTWREQD